MIKVLFLITTSIKFSTTAFKQAGCQEEILSENQTLRNMRAGGMLKDLKIKERNLLKAIIVSYELRLRCL